MSLTSTQRPVSRRPVTHRRIAAAGTTALAVFGLAWTGAVVGAAAAAGTGHGPTQVYQCTKTVERYYTGPHGTVTLVTPTGRISFPNFGYLVEHLQQTGICQTTP